MRMVLSTHNFPSHRLPMERVWYTPTGAGENHSSESYLAIPVTIETIGALALELRLEVFSSGSHHKITPLLEREKDNGEKTKIALDLYAGDCWLVLIGDEVRALDNAVFAATFSKDLYPAHEQDIPPIAQFDFERNAVVIPQMELPPLPQSE